MSLQITDILQKISDASKFGRTPELVFYSKWLEKKYYDNREEKYKRENINDYIIAKNFIQSYKADSKHSEINELYNKTKNWLDSEYQFEIIKNKDNNDEADNGLWTESKFDEEVYKINSSLDKLKNYFNEELYKSCEDSIKKLNDYLEKTKCPENCTEKCPKTSVKVLKDRLQIIKYSVDFRDYNNKQLNELENLKDHFGNLHKNGKVDSNLNYYFCKICEKMGEIYVDNVCESFRKSRYIHFDDVIKESSKYIEDIDKIIEELNEYKIKESNTIQSLKTYKGLLKKVKDLEDRDSEILKEYKTKVTKIKNCLRKETAYDDLDRAIKIARELLDYWKDYTNLFTKKDKELNKRAYEKEELKKLEDLKSRSDKLSEEEREEGYSEEIEIFDEKINVNVFQSQVSGFMKFIYKLLPILKKK